MNLISLDALITVLSFLGINEWRELIYTCKYLSSLLKPRFLQTIKLFAVSRLRNCCLDLDFEFIMKLIRDEGGYIGASIHIQLLTHDFKANNIDIFIFGTEYEDISPLHIYMLSKSKMAQNLKTIDTTQYDYYKILNIWNFYLTSGINIKVITILKAYLTMAILIQNVAADFTIDQSNYNGIEYNLYGIVDIMEKRLSYNTINRTLSLAPNRLLRSCSNNLKILLSYNSRGFLLANQK